MTSLSTRSVFVHSIGIALVALLPSTALGQGTVNAWGAGGNSSGQVSNAPLDQGIVDIIAGPGHSLALRGDRSIAAWGADSVGQVSNTPAGTGFLSIGVGQSFSLAVSANGSIVAWGSDSHSQVTGIPTGTGFTQVAGGGFHGVAMRADGSLISWGGHIGFAAATPTGAGFVQIAVGQAHAMALHADGSIWSWGGNGSGLISNSPTGTGFIHVACGYFNSMAVRADGSILAWGEDFYGQVSSAPSEPGFVGVAVGLRHIVAVRADGSLEAWGQDWGGVISDTPAGHGFLQVGAGANFSLALRDPGSGSSYCFGDGSGTACPCGATGSSGEGCNNSSQSGALLAAAGDASISNDSFGLYVTGLPSFMAGIVLRGTNQLNGGLGTVVGDGLLCTGGQTARSHVGTSSFTGNVHFPHFQGSGFGQSSYGAGVSANYQFWYRDQFNTCTGSGFNFSNAWTVTWTL